MERGISALSIVLAASLLIGCNEVRNEQGGALVGAGLGALLGSQVGGGDGKIAAAVVGGLVGAYLGGKVGRSMDETDRIRANTALESVPTGQTTSWTNPDTGSRYSMTPTATHYASSGEPCRDYTTEARIEGRRETVKGTACRQADGTWRAL